jgi:hypothetical protein
MSDYRNITLEKGMYSGKGFTKNLEELDPSENYRGTSLEGTDAFTRQLKRYDIKVSGKNSDLVDKFFSSSQTAALFPEFVIRSVASGIDSSELLSKIVATKTRIEGVDYRGINPSFSSNASDSAVILESGSIPQVELTLSKNLVNLKKRGRIFSASYESLRFQHTEILSLVLKHVGRYIAAQQLRDAVDVIIGGNDGNDDCNNSEITGALSYNELINLWNSLGEYRMTTMLVNPIDLPAILGMSEFRDAAAGLNFHATGKLITPFGAEIVKTDEVSSATVIGFDKNVALEMVQSGDICVEHDKLIDRQLDRVAITCTAGFNRMVKDSIMAYIFSE